MAVVAVALALAPAADAATPIERWAKTNKLSGKWQAKDADRDGLKNRREFALKTNPRRADSDRDGLRDGDELTVGTNPRKRRHRRRRHARRRRERGHDHAPTTARRSRSDRFVGGPVTAEVEAYTQCLRRAGDERRGRDGRGRTSR